MAKALPSKTTSINENKNQPLKFSLEQNYPNPFNPNTVISYQSTVSSHVKLVVYNMLGQEIATLVNKQQQPGNFKVKFDGSNLASGLYFYRLTIDNYGVTRKMILLK